MTDAPPLISIGMPVYNAEKSIRAAVDSILWQTCADWELILIDDGSGDATLRIAHAYDDARIRVFSDGCNRGLAARLNEAVARSRGTYFARMDGDDIAYPERLARQLDYLQTHPDVDLVGSMAVVFTSDGVVRGTRRMPESHEEICDSPASGFAMMHPTFFGRRAWFTRFAYDERLSRAQDQALLASAFMKSRFANVPQVLLGYREDAPSISGLLASRRCLAWGMGAAYWPERPLLAMRAVSVQMLKAAADVLFSQPALRRRQLARRCESVHFDELDEWNALWEMLMHHQGDSRG